MKTIRMLAVLAIVSFLTDCSLSCDERYKSAWSIISQTAYKHSSCEKNRDCVLVSVNTKCREDCPMAINRDGVSDMESAVEEANEKYCNSYEEDGCGDSKYIAAYDCGNLVPVCENSVCEVLDTGADAGISDSGIEDAGQGGSDDAGTDAG